jgi:protoporphyrinogen oxidase
MEMPRDKIVILGAGPAGMSCAYTLAKANHHPLILEKEKEPGGLCRTIDFNGYLFDIGGHRFLSDSEEINRLWAEIMGHDMLRVKRLSRIYYDGKYFNYPLSFLNTFWNIGITKSFICISSYLRCKIFQPGDNNTFEGWITNNFGRKLYDLFFKTYTEKIWAMACRDISADWAIQRIKGLSLGVAIRKTLFGIKGTSGPKTLKDEFFYPKRGPGEFYKRLERLISAQSGNFLYDTTITNIKHNRQKISSIEIKNCRGGETENIPVDYLFSSIPLPIFIRLLNPPPPQDIMAAADKLRFRSFLVVNIILNKELVFPDQWIYVHSPEVRLGRIQNYKNWNPAMVADPNKTSLGLEYFCTEEDSLWNMKDMDLIHFAVNELEKIHITSRRHLISGFVVRYPNAYPSYCFDYKKNVAAIRAYLEGFSNFQAIGRAGLFRYDNSDRALLTGIYASRNFLGDGPYDIWSDNFDDMRKSGGFKRVPQDFPGGMPGGMEPDKTKGVKKWIQVSVLK